jgi:hypothetical protein
MAGLSASLSIAIWSVCALWTVGALAYWLEYDPELVWATAAFGSVFALAEWRARPKSKKRMWVSRPGDNYD